MTLNKNNINLNQGESYQRIDSLGNICDGIVNPSFATGINCWQTTLSRVLEFSGVGLHSGMKVNVSIKPGKENTGIVFVRTDLKDGIEKRKIQANYSFVSDTSLCTTIENQYGVKVSTIEHIMAAFNGCGVDNAIVELDSPEVPIMDGSSLPFLYLIEDAGIMQQSSKREILKILKKIEVCEENKICSISPSEGSDFIVKIDFESLAVGKQSASLSIKDYGFRDLAANARTFGFMKDVEYMKSLGLGLGGNLENCVIIDGDRVINPEGLRHANEFSRHKLLDAIGDLYTAGHRIQGCYKGIRSGHHMNNLLLRKIFSSSLNYKIINSEESFLEKIDLKEQSKILTS